MQKIPTKSFWALAAIFWGSGVVLSLSIIIEGSRLVGGLAGQSDWFWVILELVIKTTPFWVLGALAAIPALSRRNAARTGPKPPPL